MRLLFPQSGSKFVGRPSRRLRQMQVRPLLQQRVPARRLAGPQDGMQKNFVVTGKSQGKAGECHGERTDDRQMIVILAIVIIHQLICRPRIIIFCLSVFLSVCLCISLIRLQTHLQDCQDSWILWRAIYDFRH